MIKNEEIDHLDEIIKVYIPNSTKEERLSYRDEFQARIDELYLAILSDDKLAAWDPFGENKNKQTGIKINYPNLRHSKRTYQD